MAPTTKVPSLTTRTVRWQALHTQELSVFESHFHDLHYNIAYDPALNDTFYLFSPETIMKISVTNTED